MRQEIEARLAGLLDDHDATARLVMTVHELLENAAKYACDARCHMRVEIGAAPDGAEVRVTLRNRTTSAHIAQLRRHVDEMRIQQDALAHYFKLMRRNAKLGSISRLGLARIRAEGEMDVALVIDGDTVTVTASMVVPGCLPPHERP